MPTCHQGSRHSRATRVAHNKHRTAPAPLSAQHFREGPAASRSNTLNSKTQKSSVAFFTQQAKASTACVRCEALWSRLVALCAAKTHARFTESLGRALLVALGQGQERRRPPTTRFKHRQRSEVVELHAPVGATRLPDHSSSPLTRHEQRSEQHMTNHADVLRLPESDAMTLRHTARALLGRL